MAPSPALLTVFAVNAATCVAYLVCSFRLRWHLRKNHPAIWSRFGFPVNSPFVSVEDEKDETHADMGLSEYLRSGEWRKLGDVRLAKLVYARRITFYAACATLLSGIVAFAVGT